MKMKPPATFTDAARETLHWLVPKEFADHSRDATGEARYLLCHAERLHESLSRLPVASGKGRCLVVGSWGLETPYLADKLGWREITCLCAPDHLPGVVQRKTRTHPNDKTKQFHFDLIEHDIEREPLPFADETFDLVVYWGCIEHLRHDPELSLYEINRVCRRGASISIVTDNAISFQATESILRGQPMPMRLHWPQAEGHWRLYTPPEIAQLLEGTGWKVDLLTTIVPDPPTYWKRWKLWLFQKIVASYRTGFGLSDAYWHSNILAHATKVDSPRRRFPEWLYKDEKIAALKAEMLVATQHCATATTQSLSFSVDLGGRRERGAEIHEPQTLAGCL